jgi:hypothetical protein
MSRCTRHRIVCKPRMYRLLVLARKERTVLERSAQRTKSLLLLLILCNKQFYSTSSKIRSLPSRTLHRRFFTYRSVPAANIGVPLLVPKKNILAPLSAPYPGQYNSSAFVGHPPPDALKSSSSINLSRYRLASGTSGVDFPTPQITTASPATALHDGTSAHFAGAGRRASHHHRRRR